MSKKRVSKVTKSNRKAENNDPLSPRNEPLFRAACAIVARKYCDWFAFWRDCRYKPCRSARRCIGDESVCLKRLSSVPYEARVVAQRRIPAEVPPKADRWLRLAHRWAPECLLLPKPERPRKAEANR